MENQLQKGKGAHLTTNQEGFLESLRQYGNVPDALKHSSMSRENLMMSLRNGRTKFYNEFQKAAKTLEKDLQYSKLSNLESLRIIRDTCMDKEDYTGAMKAIEAINKMAGHFAPTKKEVNTTNLSIEAKVGDDGKIDMTKPVKSVDEGDYSEFEEYFDEE